MIIIQHNVPSAHTLSGRDIVTAALPCMDTLLHDVEHVSRSRQKCTALLIGLSTVLITRFYLMAFPCSFCKNQKLQITRYILLSYYPLTLLTKQWLDHHSLQKYAPPDDPVFDLVPHAFAMHANAVWTDRPGVSRAPVL
jgi:hypothetical protein